MSACVPPYMLHPIRSRCVSAAHWSIPLGCTRCPIRRRRSIYRAVEPFSLFPLFYFSREKKRGFFLKPFRNLLTFAYRFVSFMPFDNTHSHTYTHIYIHTQRKAGVAFLFFVQRKSIVDSFPFGITFMIRSKFSCGLYKKGFDDNGVCVQNLSQQNGSSIVSTIPCGSIRDTPPNKQTHRNAVDCIIVTDKSTCSVDRRVDQWNK